MSRAVDKGDEHTEKASDSLPSLSSSIIVSSKSWDRRKRWCGEEEGEEEAKGEVKDTRNLCWPIWEANQLLLVTSLLILG